MDLLDFILENPRPVSQSLISILLYKELYTCVCVGGGGLWPDLACCMHAGLQSTTNVFSSSKRMSIY